ncbi:DUF6631 family protein [Citrobacter braakii]|uniref:DUF6631 family protein n=1 Tax=Citrobacter braakii TaxID=57706 RepID=UPI0035258149
MMAEKNDDLTALISERDITINGESIVIHEYNFRDTLKYHREILCIVNKLTDVLMDKSEISTDEIKSIIADHYDIVVTLVAGSVNKSVEWVNGINGQDAVDLFDWWWVVNSPFFITAVKRQEIYRDIRRKKAADKKGQMPD